MTTCGRFPRAAGLWLGTALLASAPASGSPAMIRLGYSSCQACHLSPQGRGLLTEYGKGIDDTQSAREGVYQPDESRPRRVFQDVRVLAQGSAEDRTGSAIVGSGGARVWYRNASVITRTTRVSGIVSVDAPPRDTEVTAVHPLPAQPQVFLRQALFEYMPRDGAYLAIGRDTLPSGVEIADQSTYMRARNVQGLTDVPTQVKLFLSTRRFQVAPYVFGPSGHEASGFHTGGAGVLAETYLLGDRLAAGLSTRVARNTTHHERLVGAYLRLGLGRWGVLAEHDVTHRRERHDQRLGFGQHTGYAQVFVYPVDWLVLSLGAERLTVDPPYLERRIALRPEVSARLSPHVTVATSVRHQQIDGRRATTFLVQLYVKTVS